MTFLYFAYGSNMLTKRLVASNRCPSAKPIGIAIAANHKLVFEKRSIDKSGKATLSPVEGVHTPGVLFEICNSDLTNLRRAEGSGYDRHDQFAVKCAKMSEEEVLVKTYLAKNPKDGFKPYDWYLALVIAGALQHELGCDHVKMLRQTEY